MKVLLALSCFLATAAFLYADDAPSAAQVWSWEGHYQITAVPQYHDVFASPYSGKNSLSNEAEERSSLTSTLFLGTRLFGGLQFFVDPELYGGSGMSNALGLAGSPNGEIYRVSDPYIAVGMARAYFQWDLGLGGGEEDPVGSPHQLAGKRNISRISLVAGKFSLNDFFDDNAYAHDPRSQFLNWALMDLGAWDYAADTRGYTTGVYLELDQPNWTLCGAEVQEPLTANGPDMDRDIIHARSENLELDGRWSLIGHPGTIRGIAFWNHAQMGNYRVTLNTPSYNMDVTQSRVVGNLKYGYGLNFEQEIVKGIGFFTRLGWDDGATETWAFTEIDRSGSAGVQLGGSLWHRPDDHLGLACIVNGLSDDHRDYLAAGGFGFLIGDGALNYAPEQILEAYYSYSPLKGFCLSPDLQYVRNPAYNQDRGPVNIFAVRAHFEI